MNRSAASWATFPVLTVAKTSLNPARFPVNNFLIVILTLLCDSNALLCLLRTDKFFCVHNHMIKGLVLMDSDKNSNESNSMGSSKTPEGNASEDQSDASVADLEGEIEQIYFGFCEEIG